MKRLQILFQEKPEYWPWSQGHRFSVWWQGEVWLRCSTLAAAKFAVRWMRRRKFKPVRRSLFMEIRMADALYTRFRNDRRFMF